METTTSPLSERQLQAWNEDGYLLIPALFDESELQAAIAELPRIFPTAEEFARDADPKRNDRFRMPRSARSGLNYWARSGMLSQHAQQFAGLEDFPWTGGALDRLAVHGKIAAVARSLLGDDDVRLYQAQLWAKYTGATSYAQPLHTDYMTHTLLAPSRAARPHQVEMFLYLHDVTEDLAPTHLVSRRLTRQRPSTPHRVWPEDAPELYAAEVSTPGPAGTLLVYAPDVWHRAVDLTRPGGARIWMNLGYKRAGVDWAGLQCFVRAGLSEPWRDFVAGSTPEELVLVGFPPPGHEAYDRDVLAGMALRYPGLDLAPWYAALPGERP